MHAFSADHCRSLFSGHSVVRLLIVSYFVALSFGVIEGTDISVLVSAVLPETFAQIVASGIVLALCAMILFGWHRQAAALILALSVFWASYLAMIASPDEQLGAFWRDLALIGALVLSYADGNAAPRTQIDVELAHGERPVRSRISQALDTTRAVISRPSSRSSRAESEQTELYRKDLDIVRAS